MLSVCIPVYNTDVRLLARQLADQAQKLDKNIELIFFDDCSDLKFKVLNREIQNLAGVYYQELPRNAGRSSIRNRMGKIAARPWLVFMDADTEIENPDFLRKYLHSASGNQVVCGGILYTDHPPEDKNKLLRWIYGKKREQLTARQRKARNNFAITSGNFLIEKDLFLQFGFRETIQDYGHEDTVLGYDLFKAGIKIEHIDNPVIHKPLDTSSEFLQKTGKALDNLLFINRHLIADPEFRAKMAMLKITDRLSGWGLLPFTSRLFRIFESLLVRNLTGSHPRLYLFDLYRIGYLCHRSGRGS
jgi:glycosyltransferase involved in cell wall biosynthesis